MKSAEERRLDYAYSQGALTLKGWKKRTKKVKSIQDAMIGAGLWVRKR